MKFVVLYEVSPEDLEKTPARREEFVKAYKQNPEKYGQFMRLQDGIALDFGMIGRNQGFGLVNYDNEDQMQNVVSFWRPLLKFKFIPIRQSEAGKQL